MGRQGTSRPRLRRPVFPRRRPGFPSRSAGRCRCPYPTRDPCRGRCLPPRRSGRRPPRPALCRRRHLAPRPGRGEAPGDAVPEGLPGGAEDGGADDTGAAGAEPGGPAFSSAWARTWGVDAKGRCWMTSVVPPATTTIGTTASRTRVRWRRSARSGAGTGVEADSASSAPCPRPRAVPPARSTRSVSDPRPPAARPRSPSAVTRQPRSNRSQFPGIYPMGPTVGFPVDGRPRACANPLSDTCVDVPGSGS